MAFFTVLLGETATLAGIIAQSAPSADSVAPWVSAGGSGVAVAGIVYIARLMATGRLVARDPALEARTLERLTETSLEIAKAAHEREKTLMDLLLKGRPHAG